LGSCILVSFPSKVLISVSEIGWDGGDNQRLLFTVARREAEGWTVLTKLVAHRGF
jgi:hypothetical protein